MKLLTSLRFVALICIVGLSCGKEESVNNNSNKDKIKTYTIVDPTGDNNTYNVSYDSENRVSSMVSALSPADRYEYTYNADHYIMEIYGGGLLQIHAKFFLNSSRTLIDSCVQHNNTNDTTLTKYVFNGKGQLTQQRMYEYSSSTGPVLDYVADYTYNADGLILTEEEDGMVLTYKYDKVFKRTVPFGLPFMPIQMQLPTQTVATGGGQTITTDYTYLYDNKNRLISETGTSDDGDIFMQAYTYF